MLGFIPQLAPRSAPCSKSFARRELFNEQDVVFTARASHTTLKPQVCEGHTATKRLAVKLALDFTFLPMSRAVGINAGQLRREPDPTVGPLANTPLSSPPSRGICSSRWVSSCGGCCAGTTSGIACSGGSTLSWRWGSLLARPCRGFAILCFFRRATALQSLPNTHHCLHCAVESHKKTTGTPGNPWQPLLK